jgi:hypothetical protein
MSEVSQAAERLRRYYSEDELTAEQLYGVSCLERADELWHEDNARLAQAYLDEHATDDGEPITEAWLMENYLARDWGRWRRFDMANISIYADGSEVQVWSEFGGFHFERVTTRGKLRRLLEALQ